MRRRRKAHKDFDNQSLLANLRDNASESLNSPPENAEAATNTEDFSHSDAHKWKDIDIKTIMKCEGEFFCQVLRRLLKELHCARDLDDLDDIISLSAKFLQASAAKEQAIANQIAVTKGIRLPEMKKTNCICDLDKLEDK